MALTLKEKLLQWYNFGLLSKEEANQNQRKIRDLEWEAVKPYIKIGSKFLDVGCGAGYAMLKAANELQCKVYGIDPDPGSHGVGRSGSGESLGVENIKQAFAENIPFADQEFDVVYSSHVLEHVNDEQQSLSEMKRVLKDDGLLIIGMPTADMARINLKTQRRYTLHQRYANFFLSPFIKTGKVKFWMLFAPPSHSFPESKSVYYDMKKYRVENWAHIVSKQFRIEASLFPGLYPYPEFRQWFPVIKDGKKSSSVFFVCRKK